MRSILLSIVVWMTVQVMAEEAHGARQRVLRVGAEADCPPLATVAPDGKVSGFGVELLRAVAGECGMQVVVEIGSRKELQRDFAQGRLEVLANMPSSDERAMNAAFTAPYLLADAAIFVRRGDARIGSRADLAGMAVLVADGGLVQEPARIRGSDAAPVAVDSVAAGLRLLATGHGDCLVATKMVGLALLRELRLDGITVSALQLDEPTQRLCFAVRKDDSDLRARLDSGLEAVRASGEYDRLYERSFAVLEPRTSDHGLSWRVPLAVALALGGMALVAWSWQQVLRRQIAFQTRALREREAESRKLALVASRTDNAVIITDVEGRIEWVNDGFTRITEYTLAEVKGRKPGAFLQGPDTDPATVLSVRQALRDGRPFQGELINYSKTGRRYWLAMEIQAVRDEDGRTTNFMAIESDVTDRKRVEQGLRDGERLLREITATVPGAVYQFVREADGGYRFAFMSDGFTALLGLAPEDAMGDAAALFALVHPEDVAELRASIEESARTLAPWRMDFRVAVGSDHRWLRGQSNPHPMPGGAIIWNGLLQDVSRSKQEALELERAKTAAEAANRAKSEFLAVMTHEIRTPMNGVIGMSELLAKTRLTPQQQECLSYMSVSARSLMGIINDILDLSKIEAGRMEVETQAFDLRQLIDDAIDLHAQRAHEKGLALGSHYAAGTPRHLLGDPMRIRQILVNLLTNAVKFTADGHVMVETQTVGGTGPARIRLAVTDTGIGIAPAAQDRLFQKFTQADASTTRRFGGTGLGLAICRDLARLMGGTIELRSAPGQGSTFSLLLPLLTDPAAPPDAVPPTGGRALVISENSFHSGILCGRLADLGLRVEAAAGSDAGFLTLAGASHDDPFRLAIVDDTYAALEADELASRILCDPHLVRTRLLRITSAQRLLAHADDQPSGYTSWLSSPVSHARLRDTVLALLGATGTVQAGRSEMEGRRPPLSGTVLVVDDQFINRKVVESMLGDLGFTVLLADSARRAVECAASEPLGLIFMDCMMPEMDGYEAATLIRQQEAGTSRHVPIVALTASALVGERERCLAAGMDDFLTKPLSDEELEAMARKWFRAVNGTDTR